MIAFDTNLLVRAAVADDPAQVAIVRRLLAEQRVFITRTVLLETEWVLRSRYRCTRDELHAFFAALLAAQDTVIEDAPAVARALDWYARGADFADALHLSACAGMTMHTFDQAFCAAARAAGVAPDVQVWTA